MSHHNWIKMGHKLPPMTVRDESVVPRLGLAGVRVTVLADAGQLRETGEYIVASPPHLTGRHHHHCYCPDNFRWNMARFRAHHHHHHHHHHLLLPATWEPIVMRLEARLCCLAYLSLFVSLLNISYSCLWRAGPAGRINYLPI